MNKAELIDVISEKVGISKKETEDVLDTLTNTIIKKLQDGEEVTLTGFGAFSARTRKGRVGVNPRNPSEKIDIPSVVVPKFKAGKNLKEALKGGSSNSNEPESTPEPVENSAQESESTTEEDSNTAE
ncbi:MAG: DNA-binding protein [Parcubacteria group bacterium]|nr:DNA-binding protein [Parcubacteria group bacterium]|tara:strand:+ start:1241 stop:1621 length:381 start_codon:yes stop_codon:yes gene_type:complete